MKIALEKRIFGHETCVRYKLDKVKTPDVISALTTCYLIATNKGLNLDSLFVERKGESDRKVLTGIEFFDKFNSLDEFLREYSDDYRTWHIQMSRNGYPISFGAYGANMEVGCTCHHWCLINVDKFIESVEAEVVNELEK